MLIGVQSQSAMIVISSGGSAAFIGGASSGQALASSRTVSLPAGTVEGDLAVVVVSALDTKTLNAPAGFTSVFSTTTNFGIRVAYKQLDATDISNGTLTATCGSNANMNFGLSVFRGVNYVQFAERYDTDPFDVETPLLNHTTGNHYLGIVASKSFSASVSYTATTENYIQGTESSGASGRYAQHSMDYQLNYPATESANIAWEEIGRGDDLGGSRCFIIELEDAA